MQIAFGILFLATFTEGFVEYFFASTGRTQPYLKYIALVVGVILAIAYKIDIPSMVGFVITGPMLYVSYALSGVVISRGANYANDIISSVRTTTPPPVVLSPVPAQDTIPG